jgi:hypothetical protein
VNFSKIYIGVGVKMVVMVAKRGRRSDFYSYIRDVLQSGSYNVFQIREHIEHEHNKKVSWEAIRAALEALESIGFVKKEEKSGKDYYSLSHCSTPIKDTILGLPVSKEQEKLCCEIANRIRELAPKTNNTFLQKMVVNLIKRKNLDIPYGWYLYGECCVVKLVPEFLSKYSSTHKFDTELKQIIGEFKSYGNTDELLKALYVKEGNALYLHRWKINGMLSHPFKEKPVLLDYEIKHMIFTISDMKLPRQIYEYLMEFYSDLVRLIKHPIEKMEEYRLDILSTFQSIWELIGTYEMYSTTKPKYQMDTLCYYQAAALQLKTIIEVNLDYLNGLCPYVYVSPKIRKLTDSLAD